MFSFTGALTSQSMTAIDGNYASSESPRMVPRAHTARRILPTPKAPQKPRYLVIGHLPGIYKRT